MTGISLLLVGRSGNGKSSTGNSILGSKVFKTHSSPSSSPGELQMGETEIRGQLVRVVDSLSIGDSTTDLTEGAQSLTRLAKDALSLISNQCNALLLVLKYGVRFTKQEQDAVSIIKDLLGHDVLKHYGVVTMTYGDSFEVDTEDSKIPFETWCLEQTGAVRDLFDECSQRFVLFDNRSKDPDRKTKQVDQLLRLIESIAEVRRPYSYEDFLKAEPGRIKLIVTSKLPELGQKLDIFLRDIDISLKGIEQNSDHDANIQKLTNIFEDIQKQLEFLEAEDQHTGCTWQLKTKINIVKTRVSTMINLQQLKLQKEELIPRKNNEDLENVDFINRIIYFLKKNKKTVTATIVATCSLLVLHRFRHRIFGVTKKVFFTYISLSPKVD